MKKYIFYTIIGIMVLLNLAVLGISNDIFGASPVYRPYQGGTGTSSAPTYGQMLVGTSGGVYQLQATSTLGITASETYLGTVTQVNTTYPLQGGPITDTGTLTIAFGTTTANSWNQLQTFTYASTTAISGTNSTFTSFVGALTGNADTATALASDPTDCGAGDFAISIAANGNLTCDTPAGGSGIGTVSTSSAPTKGNLAYWTSTGAWPETLGTVATTSLTASAPIALSNAISVIGSSASAISCATADTDTTGCLSDTDWDTFNNKQATISAAWPITLTGAAVGFGGVSTTTAQTWSAKQTFTYASTTAISGTNSTFTSFVGALTGNASTATSLASNGGNCNAGEYALGVDASGAVESCTDATTEINSVINGAGGTNLTCSGQTCNVDDPFSITKGTFTYASTTAISGTNATFTSFVGALTGNADTASSDSTWTLHNSYPAACTNQFVRAIGDTNTCATVSATDVSLANLTATDATLTFSGTYNGSTARTIGLNLGNANSWTARQTFTYASTTAISGTNIDLTGRLTSAYGTITYASSTAATLATSWLTTVLGAVNLGEATSLELPNGASPTVDALGEIALDSTSGQLKVYDTAVRVFTHWKYVSFAYSTSTAWTASTTIYLAPADTGETWDSVKCETNTGTLNVSFYDGTNRMNMFNASTTIGKVTLSTNNTFTASESRRVDIGTPASTPTKISCKARYSVTAD